MGILEDIETKRRFTLGPRCLVGRHASCDLSFNDPRVSGEHAIVRWVDGRWELKDLASRNGTFVGKRRLTAGERVTLGPGDVVTLGGPGIGFVVADASAPAPTARHGKTGEVRVAADQVLVLPSEERPIVTVFEDAMGRWVAEREDGAVPVQDHELVLVEGEPWVLELPVGLRSTWDASAGRILETISLRFSVSPDEEHVDVTLLDDQGSVPLPSRSFHYLLLTLARLRKEDEARASEDRGWADREELCRMLAVDSLKLNVDICRARKQLGELGVHGAAGLIERRAGSGQIRIGIDRLEISLRGRAA
ncbi:MAG: FHA domain-containing protein [Polyangiaceae bacterium]|nr:FHA domain-containing protein [Polyangiaceae bacterium]